MIVPFQDMNKPRVLMCPRCHSQDLYLVFDNGSRRKYIPPRPTSRLGRFVAPYDVPGGAPLHHISCPNCGSCFAIMWDIITNTFGIDYYPEDAFSIYIEREYCK